MVLERLSWHVTCASNTSSNLRPFILIYALMLFVLLVMIFLFSVVTSIPYAVALSASVGGVLKFTIAAAHKINVSKS